MSLNLSDIAEGEVLIEWQDCTKTRALAQEATRAKLFKNFVLRKPNVQKDLVRLGIEDEFERFYDPLGMTVARGHVGRLIACAQNLGLRIKTGPLLGSIIENAPKYQEGFLECLTVCVGGEVVQPRQHQMDMVRSCLTTRCEIGIIGTGGGKTLVTYLLNRYLLNEDPNSKMIIVVPSVTLVKQAHSDFMDFSCQDPDWNADDHICFAYGKQKIDLEKNTLVCTWQALQRKRKAFYEHWNHIIVDEVHGADAKVLFSMVEKCDNAYTKIGMTGSLKGSGAKVNDISEMKLLGLFGGRINTYASSRYLMDKGYVPMLHMLQRQLKWPAEVHKPHRDSLKKRWPDPDYKFSMQDHLERYRIERDFINTIEPRVNYIVNLINRLKGSGLVFFHSIEYLDKVKAAYEAHPDSTKMAHKIDGAVAGKKRDKMLYETIAKDTEGEHVMFATFGTTAVGISVNTFDWGIMAENYKARVKVLQSIGRMLRGEKAFVLDLYDNFEFSAKHAYERGELYESVEYTFREDEEVMSKPATGLF